MLVKTIILLLIAAMLVSLFAGLYFLVKDQGRGDRTVKALTWRISIWVVLLAFIVLAIYAGWLKPSNSLQRSIQLEQQKQQK